MARENRESDGASFIVDEQACTGCGQCFADCVPGILTLDNRKAAVIPGRADECLGCQHCLTVCPTGAVGVLGLKPEESESLKGFAPDFANLEKLVRARRSIRRFAPEDVDAGTIDTLVAAAAYAPTGANARRRRFTVVPNRRALEEFRDRTTKGLIDAAHRLPEDYIWMVDHAKMWTENREDMLFRNAPHLLVVTSDREAPCAQIDCLIAMSYFDLLAQARGVGTVWVGYVQYILELLPEARGWLGIPEDHALGYAMLFGKPAVRHARTAQVRPEDVAYIHTLRD